MISYGQRLNLWGLSSTSRTQWIQKSVGLALALASNTPLLSLDLELPPLWCSRWSNFNTSCLEVNSKSQRNCCATLLFISVTATCNLVTEDTGLMHLIFLVSVCVKVFAKHRHRSHEGPMPGPSQNNLDLEGVVLEHIHAYGMWVSTTVRLDANYYIPFTLLTLMGNPCSQASEVERAHHLYERELQCSFN